MLSPPPPRCLLEWTPWGEDRVMGLNHQLASLSCALAEAAFLNRTLVFPARLCLDARHEARSPRAPRPLDPACSLLLPSRRLVRGYSVPTASLLDLAALSRLAPLALAPLPRPANATPPAAPLVTRAYTSARVAAELPCAAAPLVVRRVASFWFRPCAYRIADTAALAARIAAALALPAERLPPHAELLPHMLRSGLFYAARLKRAARRVRMALGARGEYAAVHVRRSDKFTTDCNMAQFRRAECKQMEIDTRPEMLSAALSLWYPNGSRLYISSTEAPPYFAALRPKFELFMPEDFPAELESITDNYALYAVETLLLFGASSVVQTFGHATSWFSTACFPARLLAINGNIHRGKVASQRTGANTEGSSIQVECVGRMSARVNGVVYSSACTANPPCGTMSFIPGKGERPHGCGTLWHNAKLRSRSDPAPQRDCRS
ncbi:hypothetical protein AB1Y20_008122 [Prymnesium parvum]|uniref:DUF7075 domain-containing protein n=1 Tax=Prymnesium parvum TaxID=97485 RepID=A0AB34IVY4_PRYPA